MEELETPGGEGGEGEEEGEGGRKRRRKKQFNQVMMQAHNQMILIGVLHDCKEQVQTLLSCHVTQCIT